MQNLNISSVVNLTAAAVVVFGYLWASLANNRRMDDFTLSNSRRMDDFTLSNFKRLDAFTLSNSKRLDDLMAMNSKQLDALKDLMNARFDALTSEIRQLDRRVARLEEFQEHRLSRP